MATIALNVSVTKIFRKVTLAEDGRSVVINTSTTAPVIRISRDWGTRGPIGPKGDAGDDGVDGNTILSGFGDPTTLDGVDGDFYLNKTTFYFFGPKAGTWGSGVYIKGPTGDQGEIGYSVLNGVVDPLSGIGRDGDFYINTSTNYLFGPKATGTWPAGVSMTGSQGDAAPDVQYEYQDSDSGWTGTANSYSGTEEWIRVSLDGGSTWSSSIKFVGDQGDPGTDGTDGDQIVGFRDVSGTTDTLVAADAGKVVRYTNASDITVTVDISVHAAKDVITLLQQGAGQIIMTEGTSFTIDWPDGDNSNTKSPGQNKPIQLLFHDHDNATLIGTTS